MGYEINDSIEMLKEILPFLIPIILLQWSLMIYSLIKLIGAQSPPKYLPKWGWLLIIIFINLIGPVIYLFFGRNDE